MTRRASDIDGLWVIEPKSVTDERGTIREFFRTSAFAEAGIAAPPRWAQINLTQTSAGGIRGLHGETATKLIGLAAGTAFGAYVDARPESPTFGTVVTLDLCVGVSVLVPPGVCNGFQALQDGCQYIYCFDAEWVPGMPGVAVNPLDPALAIAWPIAVDASDPSRLSVKDATAAPFSALRGS